MTIPIQNIYYLLCYAWNRLDESELVDINVEPNTELSNLFAKVLAGGVNHVIRRGLDRGYVPFEELIPGIKGKLQLGRTLAEIPKRSGRAYCSFDELSYDVLPNQIVKATIKQLLSVVDLNSENRSALADISRRLTGVSQIRLTTSTFRKVQLHRNNSFYGFLLDVCAIIHENVLPTEESGQSRFRDFTRDERKMALLFQYFVRNFLQREQSTFSIGSPRLKWKAEASDEALELLPTMQTDMVATSKSRRIVIDTKYYADVLQSGQYRRTVHSDNLYQLYAYLRHMRASDGSLEGLLVYPSSGESLDIKYVIDGYPLRVRTVDLNENWPRIHADILTLLQ